MTLSRGFFCSREVEEGTLVPGEGEGEEGVGILQVVEEISLEAEVGAMETRPRYSLQLFAG